MNKLAKIIDDKLSHAEHSEELAEILSARRSQSTIEAYKKDWKRYCEWVSTTKHKPYPVTMPVLCDYLVWMHKYLYSVSTIQRTMTVMRMLHNETEDPTRHRMVAEVLKGIVRKDKRKPRKAQPLHLVELESMGHALLLDAKTSRDKISLRDLAILTVGWCGAMRASEIVSLAWNDVVPSRKGVEITIRESKTNKGTESEILALPLFGNDYAHICPVRALRAIAPKGKQRNMAIPVFKSVGWESQRDSLHERAVSRAINRAAKLAQLNQHYSSHSLRVGFATWAADRGEPSRVIMQHGRWKTHHIMEGYVARADLWAKNPLSKAFS